MISHGFQSVALHFSTRHVNRVGALCLRVQNRACLNGSTFQVPEAANLSATSGTILDTRPLHAIVADGTTCYPGKVAAHSQVGAFIDFGAECQGFLARSDVDLPPIGSNVAVYPMRKWKSRGVGRVDVALEPAEKPRLEWCDIPADGVTSILGRVASVGYSGVLVDIGYEKLGRISAAEIATHTWPQLHVGAEISVYLISKDKKSARLELSLHQKWIPRTPWEALVSDGQTPYKGRVVRSILKDSVYLIDINSEAYGFVADSNRGLSDGEEVTVYVVRKDRKTHKMMLSMQRRVAPLQQWGAILADGVTPHDGYVVSKPSFGGAFIDFGAEVVGLLPSHGKWSESPQELEMLEIGQKLTVFVVQKTEDTGKITLSRQPEPQPLLALHDLKADGVTPYQGQFDGEDSAGAYINFGAQCAGLLRKAKSEGSVLFEHPPEDFAGLTPQRVFDVYIVKKNPVSGKVELSLRPTAHPRLPMEEVQKNEAYTGTVYHVAFNEVLVDFGCEVTGALARDDAATTLSRGDQVSVLPVGFDEQKGRFKLRAGSDVRWVVEGDLNMDGTTTITCKLTGEKVSNKPSKGWAEVRLQDGQVYYWNIENGETTWTHPSACNMA